MNDGDMRKQESYSCSRCRKLKKRCPKQSPICKNCQKAGETCVYPGRAPRRTKRQLEEARLRGELELAQAKRKKVNNIGNSDGEFHSVAATIESATSLPSPFPTVSPGSTSASTIGTSAGPSLAGQRPPIVPIIQGKLEHELHMPDSTPIKASSIQIEAVAGIYKGGRTTPWVTSKGTYKPIERSLYDKFIAAYFTHNHKSFYMMDKVAFLNKVSTIRDFTSMDGEYEEYFIFQLYMAMAIGCTTLQRAEMLTKDEEGLSDHFAFLAMKKFCNVIHSQNMETIKCLLLLGIYALFEPKGVSSWTISGLTMRLVIGLGLHRALPPRKAQGDVAQIELRSRVFWSAYCFERLVATSLGRTSAIEDEEITVPPPQPLYQEEVDDLDVTNMMISLRRISGRIFKRVHSASAGRKQYTIEQKLAVIASLRQEIDENYQLDKEKIMQKNAGSADRRGWDSISFHSSDTWLDMRHAQLHTMLYRPSALIPKPSADSLTHLGVCCLEALKHTYILCKKKLLPLNWITLFRTLIVCNSILYCLCHWSIDLVESKIEIQQCVEILRHFGEKWVFALRCAEVFQGISNTILEISLSNGQVPNMEKLTRELFGASDHYQEVLEENDVDVLWTCDSL